MSLFNRKQSHQRATQAHVAHMNNLCGNKNCYCHDPEKVQRVVRKLDDEARSIEDEENT